MRQLLEGRRIGFALRPPLAGAALGIGIAVTLLDLMGWFAWGTRETNGFVIAAYWLSIAAAIAGLLGTVTAVAELLDVPDEDRTLARLDVASVGAATLLYMVTALVRAFDRGAAGASPPALLLAAVALLALIAGVAMSSLLYAAREWEEIEEVAPEHHRRRRVASR